MGTTALHKNWKITRNVAPRNYLILFVTAFVATIGIIWLTNVVIDPFGVHGLVSIDGFNKFKKPGLRRYDNQFKKQFKSDKPKAIIMGSSRVASISIDHPGWRSLPVSNLSLPGATIRDIVRNLKYANSVRPLKQVVVGLDFFSFDTKSKGHDDQTNSHNRLGWDRTEKTNMDSKWISRIGVRGFTNYLPLESFSINTLEHSLDTIRNQNEYEQFFIAVNERSKRFIEELADGLKRLRTIGPFTEIYPLGGTTFDDFRELVDFCYRNEIDLRLFISPMHSLWLCPSS